MEYTLKDYYTRFRSKGMSANTAIVKAREVMTDGRKPYHISAKRFIEYNPQAEKGGRWIENVATGLRFHKFADEIATRGIQHKGWFTDDEGAGEVLRGAVYLLPARNGKPQYLAGYADPNNQDCAYIVFSAYEDDETGAAYAADHLAETTAESEREYNEAYHAGADYANAGEEIAKERKVTLELIHDMKAQRSRGATPAICNALQGVIKSSLREIAGLKRKRANLLDAFNNNWHKDVWPAFNDGAGKTIFQ